VLPQEGQLPLSLHGLKQLVRDNFRAHSAATQQQQSSTSSTQQQLSPLDQGFAALRALPQQVYLESCSSSYVLNDVIIEATSCYNPKADPFASAGAITGSSSSSSSSSREQWFLYRIRVTNNRDHCIKVLGRGWVISSALGELEGYVQLTADNGIVGQQPVIPPGACFEYYSCSSLKRATGPGTMKGQLLISLLGPANQDDQQQQADEEAAADSEGSAAGAQQQEASSSSSSRRGAAAGEEVELERVAMPVAEFKLQSPATAAAAVEAARAADNAGSFAGSGCADGLQEQQQGRGGADTAEEVAAEHGSSSSSREAGSGSDSSSSDDEGSRR
jgi:uncharacterized protein affecting Mg2+/Co2+ transport